MTPDGRSLLTAGDNGPALLWTLPTPAAGDVETIRLGVEVLTGLELDVNGRIQVLAPGEWAERRRRWQERGRRSPP